MQRLNSHSNPTLTAALSVSLVAHGLALAGLAWWYIDHNSDPKSAPLDRYLVMVQRMNQTEPKPTQAIQPPPPPAKPAPPKPQAAKPAPPKPTPAPEKKKTPPPPKQKYDKPQDKLKDDSGEVDGTGTANRSSPGEKPMLADAGYEQADLMKQARDFIEHAMRPASDGSDRGSNASKPKSPAAAKQSPEVPQPLTPAASAMVSPPIHTAGQAPVHTDPGKIQQAAPVPTVSQTRSAKVPLALEPSVQSVQEEIRGHRATVSDTESIALARTNGGVFRAGKMIGRKGLPVTVVQPRYHDSSYYDEEVVGDAPTMFGAKVDGDGRVLDVEVLQSSGSSNIDQDRKLALWQWTLMPTKDKSGQITDDVWIVAFE